jgi:hypothetical protein
MPSVSVLTLVKGRRDHLSHLVEGVARSLEPPGELIIVNMDRAPLSIPRQPFSVRVIDFPSAGSLPLCAISPCMGSCESSIPASYGA